jgi:hypothetical protein
MQSVASPGPSVALHLQSAADLAEITERRAAAAGLAIALADFRADVLAAAGLAQDMTIAIREIGDPALAPWPPMRTGKCRGS